MQINRDDITVTKVKHNELAELETVFAVEFGDELNIDVIKGRIKRVRQFYYLLLPLSEVSPWVRGLFNIYIIRVKDKFAGFIQLSQMGKGQLHLDFIAICKTYRSRGIGKHVLKGLFTHVADKKAYGIVLEVRLDNPAHCLYQKLGFLTKLQILHFERIFNSDENKEFPINQEFKLEPLQKSDRSSIYELYQVSMPVSLRTITLRTKSDFNPSMFICQLNWLKNLIMKNNINEYVIKIKNRIIATVDIKSYDKAQFHLLNILLHPAYELLRGQILNQVIALLSEKYKTGKISTNIYDDLISKQHDLERAGFIKTEAYFFMYRPPQKLMLRKYQHIMQKEVQSRNNGNKIYKMIKKQEKHNKL